MSPDVGHRRLSGPNGLGTAPTCWPPSGSPHHAWSALREQAIASFPHQFLGTAGLHGAVSMTGVAVTEPSRAEPSQFLAASLPYTHP